MCLCVICDVSVSAAKTVRQRMACQSSPGWQISGSTVTSLVARSVMDCARHCTSQAHCSVYSFRSNVAELPAGADNCRLFLGYLSDPEYVADPAWNVYDMGNDCSSPA